MKLKHFAAASLCVAAGAFAAPAMAAVKVYDITPVAANTLTNILTNLDIHQFDTTLGTLTSITIEYGSSVTGKVALSNAGPKNKNTTVGLTTTMTLTGPGSLSLGSDSKSLFSGVATTAAAGSSNVIKASGSSHLSSAYSVGAGNFSLFEGTGNVVASLAINAVGTSVGQTGIVSKFTTLADGIGKVTYTYTAAPVPEPETYGMLLLGLGVVAFAAKRKSRSAQA
ncbi:choice-of-anchor E domain-containing protein [Duganella sp. FT135W]|uniref:Choice-of-anchor E domain-containing protein n=1 Tax=Duganella flavida TaxID=2692175 RepID=A0A6L8KF39_9BURK|nr:PEP-CTERM sorting domain-containing protein [Duganella flavida]MYM25317.1 choice-of-anchor E domain-containing protein [Duganella flavida]